MPLYLVACRQWRHTTNYKGQLMSFSAVEATLIDSLPGGAIGTTQYEVYMDTILVANLFAERERLTNCLRSHYYGYYYYYG